MENPRALLYFAAEVICGLVLTHDIQTHLVHQGTFCLVLRSWKLCNSGNCLMILKMYYSCLCKRRSCRRGLFVCLSVRLLKTYTRR